MLPSTQSTVAASKPQQIMRWAALTVLAVLSLLCGYLAFPILPALPVLLIMSGDSGNLFMPLLFIALASLPIWLFIWLLKLFKKGKYTLIIILCLLLLSGIGFYFKDYTQKRVETSISKVGIHIQDQTPPGILNLPDTAIPKPYFLGEKGHLVKYDFSSIEHYLKEYYANTSGDNDIIRFSYEEEECTDFYFAQSENMEVATCKAGPCILNKSYPLPEFQINDNGACASVAFTALRDDSLTREEVQAVVDSLVRVPGERPQRSFEEITKSTMQSFRSVLEGREKRSDIYSMGNEMNTPLTLSEGDCTSILSIDIAPDKHSYVIHRPVCPDTQMSYCIENGQTKIMKVPTKTIQKTHRCQE